MERLALVPWAHPTRTCPETLRLISHGALATVPVASQVKGVWAPHQPRERAAPPVTGTLTELDGCPSASSWEEGG